jgi:hypothetical protein
MGGSVIKILISFVLLALVAQAAYVFIPRYIAVYDFTSQMEKEANFARDKPEDLIVKSLLAHATKHNLNIKRENLRVTRGGGKLKIVANYTVSIPTLLYTYDWSVSSEKSAVIF